MDGKERRKEAKEGGKNGQSEEKPMYAVMPISVILYSRLTNALSLSIFS